MLDVTLLHRLYPSASAATLDGFAAQAGTVLPDFEITGTRNRLHFFLAQIGHESGGLRITEENLNYSAQRMMQVWPSRFPNLASTNGLAQNPQALANKVYGGRLGNTGPNDGWNYRGRGFIQITGKDGYREVGAIASFDLVRTPDMANDPANALRVRVRLLEVEAAQPAVRQWRFRRCHQAHQRRNERPAGPLPLAGKSPGHRRLASDGCTANTEKPGAHAARRPPQGSADQAAGPRSLCGLD